MGQSLPKIRLLRLSRGTAVARARAENRAFEAPKFSTWVNERSGRHFQAPEIPAISGGSALGAEAGRLAGGQGGIRTRDTVSRIHTFQACAFNHSATCPARCLWRPRALLSRAKAARARSLARPSRCGNVPCHCTGAAGTAHPVAVAAQTGLQATAGGVGNLGADRGRACGFSSGCWVISSSPAASSCS
jgi:hypothetical protein